MKEVDSIKIITIVDNDVWERGLLSSWGLSLHVESLKGSEKHSLLMDTSSSHKILYNNALRLDIDLSSVEAVFISHWHADHCGALNKLLSALKPQTPVFMPSGGYSRTDEIRRAGGIPVVCQKPNEFFEGVMSLGEIYANGVSEHSLATNVKERGLVVLTGCSHAGVVNILRNALKATGIETTYGVIGGFHISTTNEGLAVGEFLRDLGVRYVSPCHCTSNDAKRGIERIMVKEYARNGSGRIMSLNRPVVY